MTSGTKEHLKRITDRDMVNNPSHYNQHPSGVECINIVEHMSFNIGGAIKYLWRADHKGDAIEDMGKAIFLIKREIELKRKGNE